MGSQSIAGDPHGKGPPVGFALRARTDGSSLDRGAPSRQFRRRPQRHNQPNNEVKHMYVYIQTGPKLWTVGFYSPDDGFVGENDYDNPEKAATRVHYLNGGNIEETTNG